MERMDIKEFREAINMVDRQKEYYETLIEDYEDGRNYENDFRTSK